jgi:hypothetical protein
LYDFNLGKAQGLWLAMDIVEDEWRKNGGFKG